MKSVFPLLIVAALLVFTSSVTWADSYTARVDWAQRVELTLATSGKIENISVHTGDQVKAGDELLRLDPTPYASEVAQAEARLSRAKAESQEAERELARARELYDRGVLATVPLQHAELGLTRARSESMAAQAGLKEARYRLESSRLLAPFDAWVVRRNANVGQIVTGDLQPPVLVVLGQSGAYLARAMVDAAVAARVSKGAPATVHIGDEKYTGQVRSVALEPDENSLYEVQVVFSALSRPMIGAGAQIELP